MKEKIINKIDILCIIKQFAYNEIFQSESLVIVNSL